MIRRQSAASKLLFDFCERQARLLLLLGRQANALISKNIHAFCVSSPLLCCVIFFHLEAPMVAIARVILMILFPGYEDSNPAKVGP